jgi:hypothetical protein
MCTPNSDTLLTLLRNRGELAEGWYHPETKVKADNSFQAPDATSANYAQPTKGYDDDDDYDYENYRQNSDEDEDKIGPVPPSADTSRLKSGPSIPTMTDLQLRNEQLAIDASADRIQSRLVHKADDRLTRERLEELAPRSEPHSRERRLEKKQEAAAALRSFREAREGGVVEELGDDELMGAGGIDEYKARQREEQKKKSEREIRKEEILRARAEEREERLKERRAKEEKTMEMLRGIARERFG